MIRFSRELTIGWLEENRAHGAFDGFPEDDLIFKDLSDEDLEWYFHNWVLEDESFVECYLDLDA